MDIKIIYEDNNVLTVDKPAGLVVFSEGKTTEKTLIDLLVEKFPGLQAVGSPPRYGIVHRLDKDTSGVLLVAKSTESLIFFQKCFKNREVEKKYFCLVEGSIKEDSGKIETLIGRSPMDMRKQKAYPIDQTSPKSARQAITEWKVVERFENYTFLEIKILTGRRHQIRCHLSFLQHPIAGDKLYGFKNSKTPEGLKRQFLHAYYLKIQLPNSEIKEFKSELPDELKTILENLKIKE